VRTVTSRPSCTNLVIVVSVYCYSSLKILLFLYLRLFGLR
jgi:hypothetical protein